MNIKKIKSKIESYNNLHNILESQKNITLINILKLTREIASYYSRAIECKKYIDEIKHNYLINSPFLNNSKHIFSKFNNAINTIWIYITEEEKYATNSYERHEKFLTENYKKNDLIIAIGEKAIEFAKENKMQILLARSKNEVETLAEFLPNLLEDFITKKGFHKIKFVLNSSKLKTPFLTVLPFSELNFNLNQKNIHFEDEIEIRKVNIFPNIEEFINSEINLYLTYITLTLLNESALIFEKYKLVAETQKINNLEKTLQKLNLSLTRKIREHEIEEMSLLNPKKDLLHEK
ncbi:MSC_0622 family F1-like ATPase gamma subunit [Mycoplasmopsis gallinarum]|uniref:MSC_0622 family F1-like ATPase gamma subunit n=1 Tax=Mycoplasmopsis gallinarum TaxID=29557 RepID=UPI0004820EFA|nr:F0F1 ATP synthase subunit gamma [Mycoplasmopsis gallinarum]